MVNTLNDAINILVESLAFYRYSLEKNKAIGHKKNMTVCYCKTNAYMEALFNIMGAVPMVYITPKNVIVRIGEYSQHTEEWKFPIEDLDIFKEQSE